MIEKHWTPIGPIPITAPGTTSGILTLQTTFELHVKMIVALTDPSLPPKKVEIKRVNSHTQIEVGEPDAPIGSRSDVSMYGATSFLYFSGSKRQTIPIQEINRAVYEEEPIVAIRTIPIDPFGDYYTVENPVPVQLSDGSINIGTVNAELEVQLSAKDDDPDLGDVHDSVRIGDGTDELAINSDGSINVNIVDVNTDQTTINLYGEYPGLVSGVEQVIVSYAVPTGVTARLQRVEFSGEQIAHYRIYINGICMSSRRTHHGSGLTDEFTYIGGSEEGLPLLAGQLVELTTLHNRPGTGDFEGRLQALEIGTAIVDNLLTEGGDNLVQESGSQIIL